MAWIIGVKESSTLSQWIRQGDIMHTVTQLYRTIYSGFHRKETKVEVYSYIVPVSLRGTPISFASTMSNNRLVGTIYEKNIVSLKTQSSLFDKEEFSIGCCSSGEIDFEFYPRGEDDEEIQIPTAAMLKIYTRLYDVTNDRASEWIPKGVYFIDSREENSVSGSIKIHGFDAIDRLNLNLAKGTFSYPVQSSTVINRIASTIGVSVGNISAIASTSFTEEQINKSYMKSIKSFLCGLAAINCANFYITEDGRLSAVSALTNYTNATATITTEANDLSIGESETYSSVVVVDSDGAEFSSSGTVTSGKEILVSVPWGNQSTADSIKSSLSRFTYYPYKATSVPLDPKFEIGDPIKVSGKKSRIYKQSTEFDHLTAKDVEAPSNETATSEMSNSINSFRSAQHIYPGRGYGSDYIVSHGRNGIWQYDVWNSGRVTAYASYNMYCPVINSYGAFYSSDEQQFNLPIGIFGIEPQCFMSISKTSGHDAFLVTSDDISSTDTPKFKIVSPTSWTDYVTIDFYLVGEA